MAVLLQLLVSALVAALTVVAPAPVQPAEDYCGLHYGQPLGTTFSWQGFTFQKYVGDASCETHRQGAYVDDNVTVDADGDLVLTARRSGWTYSVGRVRLTEPQMAGRDFEWGFEARLPESPAPGARVAMWLINLDHIYCEPRWGELDVLEQYTDHPDRIHSATHATCSDSTYASWHHKPDPSAWGPAGPQGFHRWAVRKQSTARGVQLSYLLDGEVYATDRCEDVLPAGTCGAVFDRGWTAILQTAVFADESGPFLRPAPDVAFPEVSLVLRDMWVKPL